MPFVSKLFLDFIHSCRFIEISHTEETIRSMLFLVTRGLIWPYRDVFCNHNPNSENKKTYLLIFEYCKTSVLFTSGSKTYNHGILGFSPYTIIDTGYPCAEKPIWQLDVHLSTIVLSSCLLRQNLIIMLQYGGQMGYKYESLPTRKDRYTLLLESPFLILLKCTNCCLYGQGSFRLCNISLSFRSTVWHTNISKKRERQQKNGSSQALISRRYNQPAHRV